MFQFTVRINRKNSFLKKFHLYLSVEYVERRFTLCLGAFDFIKDESFEAGAADVDIDGMFRSFRCSTCFVLV